MGRFRIILSSGLLKLRSGARFEFARDLSVTSS